MGQPAEKETKTKYVKPAWYKKTERLLKWIKDLGPEIENLKLQLELDNLAGQRITAQYRDGPGGQAHSVSSPLAAVVSRQESLGEKIIYRESLLQMLENTLKSFNEQERIVYKLRYERELKDVDVYTTMNVSRSAYFELQKRVVLKAARMLNIPVPPEDQPEAWRGELFEIVWTKSGLFPD